MRGEGVTMSSATLATRTPTTSELPFAARCRSGAKCTSWRLYGPPSGVLVVFALAMFFATVSMRTRSAAMPLAAVRIPEKSLSMPSMVFLAVGQGSAAALDRRAEHFVVGSEDRGVGLVQQAVLAQAVQLLLQVHGVAVVARGCH